MVRVLLVYTGFGSRCNQLYAIFEFPARKEGGQMMIMAALLVQMTDPRCQRVHKELGEGLVHRDAVNKHQERPDAVLRHRNPAIRGATRTFGQWGWS